MHPDRIGKSIEEQTKSDATADHRLRIMDRHQFGLSFLMALIFLASILLALFPFQNSYSRAILGIMGLTWLLGSRETKHAALLMVPCLLLPYTWLVLVDYPWGPYRWSWVRMWACLPTMLPSAYFFLGETARFWAAAISTSLLFLVLVSMIRFRPTTRWWVFFFTLVVNLCCSFGLYHAFHA